MKQVGQYLKTITAANRRAGAMNSPNFLVDPSGQTFPVPKGATGHSAVANPTGSAFTGGAGGEKGQVNTMRIMNPTPPRGKSPGYPNGYIKYKNMNGQGVNPYTGKTSSNLENHYPIGGSE